jgi:hypothetical protein
MRQADWPAVLCCAVLIVPSGCTTSTPDLEVADVLRDVGSATDRSEQRGQEFDFGTVLTSGRTLRHAFSLSNPSDRPLRLLKAASSIPCCSAVGPLARTIPPGGEVQVPIIVKTENKVGHLRVDFAVETDAPIIPIRRFAVSVRLVRDWEIEAEGDLVEPLSLGQPGKLSYRIVCRRKGTEGRGLPDKVTASGPIRAVLGTSAEESNKPGGINEASRTVDVELAASSGAGRRQGELIFQWADGRTQSHLVSWEVRPRIGVMPPGLVIQPSREPVPVVLTVASDDRPIRIVKVDGPLAKPFAPSSEMKRIHPLRLLVDPSQAAQDSIADIKITTDHPVQPFVSAALLVSGSAAGDNQ